MDVGKITGGIPSPGTIGSLPSLHKESGFSSFDKPQKSDEDKGAKGQENMTDLVERFRSQVQSIQRDLSFSVDDSTGDVVVKVIDGDSGKVVRQIPSEEILRLTERLDEMRSLMFKAKA
ncbi:flagellar protein FlaG [Stutzerimonas stutzeri]|jgi:flagellar protein FlaG|uniref:flagellar protein FlaG n=1 Tax=Stutzerimonas stutzeri TaxID=316 RepID=UPI00210A8BC3|nr:flagellar protein FlaG [Stutzerimonas stutzeri]MCQ4258386.1 flagellar protein FlaG [Stutzerimonas stutzeri]